MSVREEHTTLHEFINVRRLICGVVVDVLILAHAGDPMVHIVDGYEEDVGGLVSAVGSRQ